MVRKIFLSLIMVSCALNLTGCIPLLAGGGAAKWLTDKLVQNVNATYEQTIDAARSGLTALNLNITKENSSTKATQLRAQYTDGRKVSVDILSMGGDKARLEIRVGMVNGQEESRKILNSIIPYLPSGAIGDK
jgi:hypothetical protein